MDRAHDRVGPARSHRTRGRRGPEHTAEFLALEAPIDALVHDAVVARQGSISAEHGRGVLRRDESARHESPVDLGLMPAIKPSRLPSTP
jgi:FAD/FMN-containing dehydrogenase